MHGRPAHATPSAHKHPNPNLVYNVQRHTARAQIHQPSLVCVRYSIIVTTVSRSAAAEVNFEMQVHGPALFGAGEAGEAVEG